MRSKQPKQPDLFVESPTDERGDFSGHETFPLRFTWLPKAVREVEADAQVFGREDALVRFGVGKNMVRAIRHWGFACGVLEEDPLVTNNRGRFLQPTDLGRRLLGTNGWDPFLEDPASLWLLQWHLASRKDSATTWFWVFNLMPQPEFSKAELLAWLSAYVRQQGWLKVSDESLGRDIDCLVRTYVPASASKGSPIEDILDCPLVELGLIREFGPRNSFLMCRENHQSLADEIFAYALLCFLHGRSGATKTVGLDTLAFTAGAPGRVFGLSEDALLARLERLDRITDGAVTFDETAGLRQVIVKHLPPAATLLQRYFDRRKSSRRIERQAS